MGFTEYLCGSNCLCDLPSAVFNYQYSKYDTLGTIEGSRALARSANGFKKTQECAFFDNKYDKVRRALIEVMGEVERQFDCSGICYTSNLSVAYDSTNA